MAKKQKRRPFRRPNPRQRSEDAAFKQRSLEAAANTLLANRSTEQLRAELSDRELLLSEADQAAQMDPSPANLARYRAASSEHAATRLALELADRRQPGAV
jgi:hypothetical protein